MSKQKPTIEDIAKSCGLQIVDNRLVNPAEEMMKRSNIIEKCSESKIKTVAKEVINEHFSDNDELNLSRFREAMAAKYLKKKLYFSAIKPPKFIRHLRDINRCKDD